MPNIREISSPSDLGLTPTDRGINAAASAASRIGGLYEQAAAAKNEVASINSDLGNRVGSTIQDAGDVAVKSIEHQEISHGAASFATAMSGLDNFWNKTINAANANDPSVAGKFREDVLEPQLDQLRDAFVTEGGQRYAEAQIDRIRDHFVTKTSADMSTEAGIAVRQNINTLTNQLSNAAINDPSSLKTSLDLIEHSVGAMVDSSPNLQGVDSARIKSEILQTSQAAIVKSAAVGAIAANPDAGLKQFSGPEYSKYISGAELKSLQQQAQVVQRAERVDQTYQRTQQKQAATDASDQREGEYIAKLHSDDPQVASTVSAKAIANDFTLTREARERMIGIVERETKPDTSAAVSAQSSVQIMKMMRDPNAEPQTIRNAILEARVKDPGAPGSITKADMTDLQKQLDDLKTPQGAALASDRNEFLKQYGPTVDPEMKLGNPTPLGAQGLYRLEKDARRQERELQGKSIDPHSLYDPNSQYFLGKPDRIDSYRPSLADKTAFEARLKADKTRPAAVQPGQSVNLTGNGSVTGMQTLAIPAGMAPGDAMKWARDKGAKSGDKVKLPDGRIGTVQ